MATPEISAQVIVQIAEDEGESPVLRVDPSFCLTGWEDRTEKVVTIASGDADASVAIDDDACFVFVYSLDNKFSMRLAAGETLFTDLMIFGPIVGYETTGTAYPNGELLFTGNGHTASRVKIITVKTTT